jgi:hypothetical protein
LIDKVQHRHIPQNVVPFAVVVKDVLQREITGIIDDESQAGRKRDGRREVNREVSLSTLLASTQYAARKLDSILPAPTRHLPVHDSEQLSQSLLPPTVSSRRRLDGESVAGSVVSNDGNAAETETESSGEFQNGREAANLDKVIVAIDVL